MTCIEPNLPRTLPGISAKTTEPRANGGNRIQGLRAVVRLTVWKYTGRKYEMFCTSTDEERINRNAVAEVQALDRHSDVLGNLGSFGSIYQGMVDWRQ
jgi:hypothetical protein